MLENQIPITVLHTLIKVENDMEKSTSEDLWKAFARYGRVGDLYIPNKVDKWGRRFAFVKFRDVKEVSVLSQSMKEVWLGSFKLRINQSRFERKEEARKNVEIGESNVRNNGEGSSQPNRSFKAALVQQSRRQEVVTKKGEDLEEVLQVEVDGRVLEELERSFVGKLALDVEVRRIKTTLYMEGLAHISISEMGRNMVLLYSPKVGEVEALCKAKADWLTYYFKEVRPWSPSSFVDKRKTWVKVYGIPLHVWGESLFKAIGNKYGEFIDFDNNTASRAKLDVARIKISTNFRGNIDDSLVVQALGVLYTLQIVEQNIREHVFHQQQLNGEQECSWVESSNFPGEAMEVRGGVHGGAVEDEEDEEEDEVDFQPGQHKAHGEYVLGDGDVSLNIVGKSQSIFLLAGSNLNDNKETNAQKDTESEGVMFDVDEVEVGGTLGEKVVKGDRVGEDVEAGYSVRETCHMVEKDLCTSGPHYLHCDSRKVVTRSAFWEPRRCGTRVRSFSLPPFGSGGPDFILGQEVDIGLDLSDSFSLTDVRRGGVHFSEADEENVTQIIPNSNGVRRGRSRRRGGRPKSSHRGAPRCLRLLEAVREGGGKRYCKRKGKETVMSQSSNKDSGSGEMCCSDNVDKEDTVVAETAEGIILEVVLPRIEPTPTSGLNLLLEADTEEVNQNRSQLNSDASKLLYIQKNVGFRYEEPDDVVVKVLAEDEQRDRLKKQEWEQRNGYQ
ncbi:hypothetical protein L195_g013415 [Trifolium pratense]|uniref:RRM domain-containing protein n=1 Tax=Trifolium pratense TaxID=57577 RepID=A0A2K3PN34_TRIPR|nr:hypothetical protein L195_g013415 [Trifolium pratense]